MTDEPESDGSDKVGCGWVLWLLLASTIVAIVWQQFEADDPPEPDYFEMECDMLYPAMYRARDEGRDGTADLILDEITTRC